MSVVFICDYCDWEGKREDYDQHIADSPKCDDRPACCKVESIKDYEDFEAWEICDSCLRKLDDYYEDSYTDALMESYYEGQY